MLSTAAAENRLVICGMLALPAALLVLYLLARRAPAEQRPRIKEYSHPRQVRALVMFLSTPPKPPSLICEIAEGQKQVSPTDPDLLASIGSWRIALAAIDYHADQYRDRQAKYLEQVVLIPSRDRFLDSTPSGGTYRHLDTFRQFVTKLVEQDPRLSRFEVRSLQELIVASRLGSSSSHDYSQGVDYESPNEIEEAVNVAYEALHKLGIADQDILIDITGGQKPASVAGAVVALGVNRRIQYVSMHDYRVRVYDVTFDE